MPILCPSTPAVNPPIAYPTPAEREFADRLAHAADGGDPEGYRPDWRKPAPPPADLMEVGPSAEDEAHETGYAIGLEGESPLIESVNGSLDNPWPSAVRAAFYRGLSAGRREHSRRTGHAQGLAGFGPERPAAIPRLYDREFAAGWVRGADEWADRATIEAEWAAEYEADCQAKMDLDFNREANGYHRADLAAVA